MPCEVPGNKAPNGPQSPAEPQPPCPDSSSPPKEAKKGRPRRTDSGNAELIASISGDHLRFDHARKRWLVWREDWWAEDIDGYVTRLARNAARLRYQSALEISGKGEKKKESAWALQSESRYRLDAAVKLAQSVRPLADPGSEWDANPWLFGVANGVADLRTGNFRRGNPSDRITVHTDIQFDTSARCPRWNQFLVEVFEGNQELIDFVQRAVGYSLTGDTSEQCLFLCFGGGSNGKSTFLEVLRHMAGGYGHNMPFSALEIKARTSIPNDVAALAGRRLVTASETNESIRLNEERVKALTGSDAITARFLNKEFFTFHPVAKFWLAFNHKPRVADDSYGFWRRIRLIPFLHEFEDSARDKQLLGKLLAEAPGILVWAVQGCLAWQKEGLGLPVAVKAATEAYREEMDSIAEFLDDRCIVHPNARVTAAALWEEYLDYAKGEHWQVDRRSFTARMESHKFLKVRAGHDRIWTWTGLCLKIEQNRQNIPVPADVRTGADANSEVLLNTPRPI